MIVEGDKVVLRDLALEDLDLLAYWMDPAHQWHETDGPYYPPTPKEEIPARIEKLSSEIKQRKLPPMRSHLVIADKKNNLLLGRMSRYWISEETNWMALGIVIFDPENWQSGIGTESLRLWCDYLFNADPTLVRLDMRTWSGNIGMMKLAERVGFKKEAIFRKARIVKGKYFDGIGYGLLREEWENIS